MEFSAIFHDTTKKYAYALAKGQFAIRIKTKKNDIRRVTLLYQDKYIPIDFYDTRECRDMYKIASDNYCDYYEVRIYPVLTEGRMKAVFCDDAQGVFAITRELDGTQMVLLAHAKEDEVLLTEENGWKDFAGMTNLIKMQTFSGKISAFELAVLVKK